MTKYQEDLVNSNIKLVYKITSGFNVSKKDRKDLIQEGFFALCLAAQRFDPMRGDAFTTYAYSYISGRCKYFISRNAIIRPARSKESGYKQFLTYEVNNLDDYMYMPDPNGDILLTEVDVIVDALKESDGEVVSKVVLLSSQGFTEREIAKQLGLKLSEVNSIYASLRENEFINKILRSNNGTRTVNSTEEAGEKTEYQLNDGSTAPSSSI